MGNGAATGPGAAGALSSDVGTGLFYAYPSYSGTDVTGSMGTGATANGGTYGANGAGAAGGGSGSSIGAGGGGMAGESTGVNGGYAGAAIATPQLNAATRREARHERATVARRGQMLESIAPRGNADLGWQMPDDPTSPALATPDRPVVRY
jgi:hypothetical protein